MEVEQCWLEGNLWKDNSNFSKMEENKMGESKGACSFPVIMWTVTDKFVPQCEQQKFTFYDVAR